MPPDVAIVTPVGQPSPAVEPPLDAVVVVVAGGVLVLEEEDELELLLFELVLLDGAAAVS